MKKWKPYTLVGIGNLTNSEGRLVVGFRNLEIYLPVDLVISFIEIYRNEVSGSMYKDLIVRMFMAVTFILMKIEWNTLSTKEWHVHTVERDTAIWGDVLEVNF